jgi:hypothetical protein
MSSSASSHSADPALGAQTGAAKHQPAMLSLSHGTQGRHRPHASRQPIGYYYQHVATLRSHRTASVQVSAYPAAAPPAARACKCIPRHAAGAREYAGSAGRKSADRLQSRHLTAPTPNSGAAAHSDLPRHCHVQQRTQRPGDLGGDWHPTAGQAEDYGIGPAAARGADQWLPPGGRTHCPSAGTTSGGVFGLVVKAVLGWVTAKVYRQFRGEGS